MIVLFTDFGPSGLYVGQMQMVLHRQAPGIPVVDLCNNAPAFNPEASAYLLRAYAGGLGPGDVLLGVVDPGVGGDRRALALNIDGLWCVGPDNGLFSQVLAARPGPVRALEITWQPDGLSASFHGRDLFAPVAAGLARGREPQGVAIDPDGLVGRAWPSDLPEIIYIDDFGNAITGLRADSLLPSARLHVGEHILTRSETFSTVLPGEGFWYENANGLVELAVNSGRADQVFDIVIGSSIKVTK